MQQPEVITGEMAQEVLAKERLKQSKWVTESKIKVLNKPEDLFFLPKKATASLSSEGVLTIRRPYRGGGMEIVRQMTGVEWFESEGVRQVSAMPVTPWESSSEQEAMKVQLRDLVAEADYHAQEHMVTFDDSAWLEDHL